MRDWTRGRRWALLLLVLALIATACGGGEQAGQGSEEEAPAEGTEAAQGGEFSVFISEPEHLSPPSNVTESEGAEVVNALYAPLVDIDFDGPKVLSGEDAPDAVAESVETEDNVVFTITLKDGWTMHNGEPLTAQNYVDAWNYGAYGPNANNGAYFFADIEGYDDLQCPDTDDEGNCIGEPTVTEMSGLEVVDDLTFRVTLTAPFSIFPLLLQYQVFHPVPADFLDDPEQYVEQPVGNGPFMMEEPWAHDQYVRVVRSEEYAGTPAPADAVEYRIYDQIDTAYNDLLAGNLDIMDGVPAAQLESAEAEFGDRFVFGDSPIIQYMGFPTYDERFSNPELRRAFSMAIDRQAIADAVRPDYTPLTGFVPSVVPGALADNCGGNCEFNPEEARQLLEEAGGFEGDLVLWFNAGADHDAWVEAVSNQLRQNLGIENITFQQLQFAEYLPLLETFQATGPFRLGWQPDYPSPHTYLNSLYATGASSNYTEFSDPQFDELMAQGEQAESPEQSVQFFQQAEEILNDTMPSIPLFSSARVGAWSERVQGVEIDFFDNANVREITVTE